jgi:hypothetical protein
MRHPHFTSVIGVSIVAAAMMFGGAGAAQAATGPAGDVAVQTNALRAAHGLAALRPDATLDSVAQQWADQMAATGFRHSPNAWRGAAIPQGWSWNGENIAEGYTSASAVMAGWIGSPDHYANLVSPNYTRIGVGYDSAAGMWVQVFAGYPSDRGAPAAVAAAPAAPRVVTRAPAAPRAVAPAPVAAAPAPVAAPVAAPAAPVAPVVPVAVPSPNSSIPASSVPFTTEAIAAGATKGFAYTCVRMTEARVTAEATSARIAG